MLLPLYNLPNWLMGLTIIGTIVVLTYIGYFLFHRLLRQEFSDNHKSVAMSVLQPSLTTRLPELPTT